jgi:hypothetical protein
MCRCERKPQAVARIQGRAQPVCAEADGEIVEKGSCLMTTSLHSGSGFSNTPIRVSRPTAALLSLLTLPFGVVGTLMVIAGVAATVRALSGSGADVYKGVLTLVVCTPLAAVALTAAWRLARQAVTGRETSLISWPVAVPALAGAAVPSGVVVALMRVVELTPATRVQLFIGLSVITSVVALLWVRRRHAPPADS